MNHQTKANKQAKLNDLKRQILAFPIPPQPIVPEPHKPRNFVIPPDLENIIKEYQQLEKEIADDR